MGRTWPKRVVKNLLAIIVFVVVFLRGGQSEVEVNLPFISFEISDGKITPKAVGFQIPIPFGSVEVKSEIYSEDPNILHVLIRPKKDEDYQHFVVELGKENLQLDFDIATRVLFTDRGPVWQNRRGDLLVTYEGNILEVDASSGQVQYLFLHPRGQDDRNAICNWRYKPNIITETVRANAPGAIGKLFLAKPLDGINYLLWFVPCQVAKTQGVEAGKMADALIRFFVVVFSSVLTIRNLDSKRFVVMGIVFALCVLIVLGIPERALF